MREILINSSGLQPGGEIADNFVLLVLPLMSFVVNNSYQLRMFHFVRHDT